MRNPVSGERRWSTGGHRGQDVADAAVVDGLGTDLAADHPARHCWWWAPPAGPGRWPGPSRRALLQENIAAADVELTADDLSQIEAAAAAIPVQGGRYPEHLEKMTNL